MTPSTSDEKKPTMHPRRQFACDDEAERDKWVGHLEAMVADAQALAREDHGHGHNAAHAHAGGHDCCGGDHREPGTKNGDHAHGHR